MDTPTDTSCECECSCRHDLRYAVYDAFSMSMRRQGITHSDSQMYNIVKQKMATMVKREDVWKKCNCCVRHRKL